MKKIQSWYIATALALLKILEIWELVYLELVSQIPQLKKLPLRCNNFISIAVVFYAVIDIYNEGEFVK